MITIIEVTESGLREDDPERVNKMMGQKEGLFGKQEPGIVS